MPSIFNYLPITASFTVDEALPCGAQLFGQIIIVRFHTHL